MTETDATAEHPILQSRPGTWWTALVAWVVIVVVVVGVFMRQRKIMARAKQTNHDTSFQRNLIELQGRQFVGNKLLTGQGPQLYEQAQFLNRGSFRQRLRFAVLAGELAGPNKALELLKRLGPPNKQSDSSAGEDRKLYDDLHRLYEGYARQEHDPAALLPEAERERLHKDLGWFGDLALAPAKGPDQKARAAVLAPAKRMMEVFIPGVLVVIGLGAVGFVALVALVVLLIARPWLRGFIPGTSSGAIYAETFALWMLLFIGLGLGSGWLLPNFPVLLRSSLVSLLSLLALVWPVCRGVPWRQVRQDIGLHGGRGPLVETASGLATYIMALPLLIGGLIVLLVTAYFLKRGGSGPFDNNTPAHPLVGVAANDWWVRVQVVLAASFVAPLVEETMFRGVFYRHLREATRGGGFVLSVLVSGLVSSFIFAVIHPQGALAVPPLMGLAFGFAIGREWRGSLLPCMVAHGVHNGILVLFFLTALSG